MPQTRHRPVFCLKTLPPHWNCPNRCMHRTVLCFAGAALCPAQSAAGRTGTFAGLAGSEPGCRSTCTVAGALFCCTGHRPCRRTIRQPLCHSAYRARRELELQLLCLDPAPFVDASLAAGRSAALFSATLAPPSFYRSVLGCSDARAVALDSPFPAENLGLYCLPNISTRYRDREASVQAVSDALARLVQARTGNYFAFSQATHICGRYTKICSTLPGHSHPCAGKPSG